MEWIGSLLMGLWAGRWANTLIHRLPRGESPFRPFHSVCPYCRTKLNVWETIPVLSYFILRRECRHCHAPIAPRYPVVEGLCALLFVACYARFGASWALLPACALCFVLLILSMVDLEHTMVLDELLIAGLIVAVPCNVFASALCTWPEMLLGVAAGAGPLLLLAWAGKRLAGRAVMGGGDVKLMGMVGAFVGWQGALLALCAGSILGGMVGAALLLTQKAKRGSEIPFVPMLSAGALISLFFAQWLIVWYQGLFAI